MMLPLKLAEILETNSSPEAVLGALMPAIAEFLDSDRCFLYLRNPETRLGRVPFCWTRDPDIPRMYDETWKPESDSLADEDPMFAAALQCKPSIFVEDVTTESPEILNIEFERENFGHCALIHAHVCQNHQLWGILQPCLMHNPRHWTPEEQAIILRITECIARSSFTMLNKMQNLP
jgi:GAF domain-containing protein